MRTERREEEKSGRDKMSDTQGVRYSRRERNDRLKYQSSEKETDKMKNADWETERERAEERESKG